MAKGVVVIGSGGGDLADRLARQLGDVEVSRLDEAGACEALEPDALVVIHGPSFAHDAEGLRRVLAASEGHRRWLLGDAPAAADGTVARLDWPAPLDPLCRLLREAWAERRDRDLARDLALGLQLVGASPRFRRTLDLVRKYARCDAPVLVLGETGTGKEKIARALHYLRETRGAPFVAVNCGALPDSLVENELFGHVRGAFTDARGDQPGLVEQAAGGTLFLDEIEALSLKGQVVLLRFLQEYEFRPLGGGTRRVQVRLVCASNRRLEPLVEEGRFREDLFYRINILPLQVPPLRERPQDIPLLAEHFLAGYRQRYGQPGRHLAPETLAWMQTHAWPGNVRELENLLLREFLLAEEDCIRIPPPSYEGPERRGAVFDRRFHDLYQRRFQEAKALLVEHFERSYLRHVLEASGGNVSHAARLAGKERRTFSKLLRKHGLGRPRPA